MSSYAHIKYKMFTIYPNGDSVSTAEYTKVWSSEAAAFWLGQF